MARRLFFITFTFLQLPHLLLTSQEWNCEEGNINMALIYDCRYNIQSQSTFFAQLLNKFKPFKLITDQYKAGNEQYSFNLFLMTYRSTAMKTFETFTQKNYTQANFSELQLNTSLCPYHLPTEHVFNETHNVLNSVGNFQRKLAIFIMGENITEEISNHKVYRWLENKQILNANIKRLFIIMDHRTKMAERGAYVINTNTLNDTDKLVEKSIGLICSLCNTNYIGHKNDRSCYFVMNEQKVLSRNDADVLCGKTWPKSRLVSLNTQRELTFVKNILKNHFTDLMFQKQVCKLNLECLPFRRIRSIFRSYGRNLTYPYRKRECKFIWRCNSLTYYFKTFVGLRFRNSNSTVEYTWNDNTPFVIMANLPPADERKNCFYLSQQYDIDRFKVVTSDDFQWINYGCKKKGVTDILLCESEMTDKPIQIIDHKDLLPKKDVTYSQIIYKSFETLFFNFFNNDVNDAIKLIMKNKINFTITLMKLTDNCSFATERRKSISFQQIASSVQSDISYTCDFNRKFILTLSNDSEINAMFMRAPNLTENNCLYEIDSKRVRIRMNNNYLLQNCENFVCPGGFVKCPDSYCIPAYLVHDGTNDCPHGEDEGFIYDGTSLCQGKLKFTLKNICLTNYICDANNQCLNKSNNLLCKAACSDKYICMSNLKRNSSNLNSIFYEVIIETTVQLFEETNSFFFTPQVYSLFPFFKLTDINLSQCTVRNLDNVIEKLDNSALISLDVSRNNMLMNNRFSAMEAMPNLHTLNLSFNENLELHENLLFPLNLKVIDLSYTKCGKGIIKTLVNFTHLSILVLRHVEPIDLSKVSGNVKLDILDVRGTEIVNIHNDYLSWLSISKAFYTDDFRLCCDVIRGEKIQADTCHAPRDAISTCQDLIGDPLKRAILWVVGGLSLLGNLVVVIYRLLWDMSVFKTAYGLFVVCLGVADFIMGVYLLIVAGADMLYRNLYVLNDIYWRHSSMCKLAGILSTFSSETSTMFICLITLDRYLVIQYPFGQHRFSKSGKITSIFLTLIIGVVVSVIPAVFPGWEIYSTNGMCLALPFSSGRHGGWEYSVVLFVGLNFVLFILIAIGQIAIFRAITYKEKNFSNKRDNRRKAEDFAVARQLFLVAMSDFCCWFPIGIMGIMSLNGYHFNPEVYAWSAVLILPVNSAINPLIYTFPVILRKINSKHIESRMSLNESFKN